ncbi:MAG: hypothetical protein JXO72_08400 [Vicinamibacteria bacterium]|nr:hypothetical protein [Vicinamibacteria bacterium]
MRSSRRERLIAVITAYAVITIAMTWPVAARIAHDLPADLGDPVLNCWILAWDADHIVRFIGGEWEAFRGYWNANIFHPEPLALAYSEHLTAQAVQIAIPYALTRNPILCHNLLFLSTFFLSALGAFFLVRELSGDDRAASISGLLYGFGLYRFTQLPHLQVLSAQWMPFVLLGLRLFVRKRSRLALAFGCSALIMQNLSCGYHLMYFSPVAAIYVLFEMTIQGRLRDHRVWTDLMIAGLTIIALSLPFLLPYLELHARNGIVRRLWEVKLFSADAYSYLTANSYSRLWGGVIRAYSKPEGALFPGLSILMLGALAVLGELIEAFRHERRSTAVAPAHGLVDWRSVIIITACLVMFLHAVGGLMIALGARGRFYGINRIVPLRDFNFNLAAVVVSVIVLWMISENTRRMAARFFRSGVGFSVLAAATALLLSLGPTMHSRGVAFGGGPYAWLYDFVPGFDGLRVPARFAWVSFLFLVILAGHGSARLMRRFPGGCRTALITTTLGFLILFESFAAPLPMNLPYWTGIRRMLPRRLETGPHPAGVYRAVAALPADSVLAELPFGEAASDLRYMYSSTFHWRKLLNGFSGALPPRYPKLAADLSGALRDPNRAWHALECSPATHVVVHEGFWGIRRKGRRLTRWLIENGCVIVAREGDDALLALPRRNPAFAPTRRRTALPVNRVWQNVEDERLARLLALNGSFALME